MRNVKEITAAPKTNNVVTRTAEDLNLRLDKREYNRNPRCIISQVFLQSLCTRHYIYPKNPSSPSLLQTNTQTNIDTEEKLRCIFYWTIQPELPSPLTTPHAPTGLHV